METFLRQPGDQCILVLSEIDLIKPENYSGIDNVKLEDFVWEDFIGVPKLIIFNDRNGNTKILANTYGSVGVVGGTQSGIQMLIEKGLIKVKESKTEDLGLKKFESYKPIEGKPNGVQAPGYDFGKVPEPPQNRFLKEGDEPPPPPSKL